MAAMRRTSLMPPAWERSGWMISAQPRSNSSLKPQRVKLRSPVASGILLRRCRSAKASRFSTRTGSSTNSGFSGSSSFSKVRAMLWCARPWKSMAIPTSGPAASRTACTRSSRSLIALRSSIHPVAQVPNIFTVVKPCAIFSFTERAAISGVSESIQLYTAILSRTAPPSKSYTGTPSDLPLISHNAWSIPERALVSTGPPR